MLLLACWNLRDIIEEFYVLYGTEDIKKDKLTNIKQATIRTIKDFLEKLLIATKACELK